MDLRTTFCQYKHTGQRHTDRFPRRCRRLAESWLLRAAVPRPPHLRSVNAPVGCARPGCADCGGVAAAAAAEPPGMLRAADEWAANRSTSVEYGNCSRQSARASRWKHKQPRPPVVLSAVRPRHPEGHSAAYYLVGRGRGNNWVKAPRLWLDSRRRPHPSFITNLRHPCHDCQTSMSTCGDDDVRNHERRHHSRNEVLSTRHHQEHSCPCRP